MAGGQAVRTATGGAGAAVAEAVIDGAIGGAAGELFQTAIDEATWDRGVASALAALLAALARVRRWAPVPVWSAAWPRRAWARPGGAWPAAMARRR
jgi:ABC-type Co2+ transport system permease subunit